MKSHFANCSLYTPCSFLAHPGADITRAGNKTSAGGQVSGPAGRKALGESLDTPSACLSGDIPALSTKGAAKAKANAKRQAKGKAKAKAKDEKHEQNKRLQKDIKSLLTFISYGCGSGCCIFPFISMTPSRSHCN